MRSTLGFALVGLLAALGVHAHAEDGRRAWLRYAPIANPQQYRDLPSQIVVFGGTPTDKAAAHELQEGLTSILGRPFTVASPDHPVRRRPSERHPAQLDINSLATGQRRPIRPRDLRRAVSYPARNGGRPHPYAGHRRGPRSPNSTQSSTCWKKWQRNVRSQPTIANHPQPPSDGPMNGITSTAPLNGATQGHPSSLSPAISAKTSPAPREYARLLASVGLNGCNINNVNANLETLSTEHLHEFARVAEVFRPWGRSAFAFNRSDKSTDNRPSLNL